MTKASMPNTRGPTGARARLVRFRTSASRRNGRAWRALLSPIAGFFRVRRLLTLRNPTSCGGAVNSRVGWKADLRESRGPTLDRAASRHSRPLTETG
jgi:hypothetical protein